MAKGFYRGQTAMYNFFQKFLQDYLAGMGEGGQFQDMLESLYKSQEPMMMEGMKKFGHQAAGFGQVVPGEGFSSEAKAGERDLMESFMADITGQALGAYQMPYSGLFGGTPQMSQQYMGTKSAPTASEQLQQPFMGTCCFIFVEADNGNLDRIARRFRDESGTPKAKSGYRRLANWLVPKMRESKAIKNLVRFFMVKPMIGAGGFAYRENHWGYLFVPLAIAWIMVFELLGMRRDYDFVHSASV